jgi:hypothetical protein
MAQIRKEIYNEDGLVEVQFIEVEDTNTDELLKQKEMELLAIYEEIQKLKNENNY